MTSQPRTILLTGATGYVGGRLLTRLEQAGYRVRCLTRRPQALADAAERGVEVVAGDVLDYDSLAPALAGVDTAFYFVHSMGSNADFEDEDRRAAENFARAAKENGVQVIYGHSRGGAILADMNTNPDVQKVGLDSAMIISENKDMLNLNEYKRGSLNPYDYFDGLIGFGGKKNVTVNLGDNMHHAWN